MSKVNPTRKQSISQNNVTSLLIGAAAGGVVGATVALLFAPKSGDKLRKDLFETYDDVSERAQDFMHDVSKKGQKAASIAGDYAEDLKETASHFISDAEEITHSKLALMIGAIGGGILGASAIFLMAPKPEEMGDVCRSATQKLKSFEWVDTAKQVISNLNKTLNPQNIDEEDVYEAAEKGKNQFQDALELASLGFRLWQNINKRG